MRDKHPSIQPLPTAMNKFSFDSLNARIAEQRWHEWNSLGGIRVGDIIRLTDGKMKRVTVLHGGGTFQAFENGSFHFSGAASVNHSGACGIETYQVSDFEQSHPSEYGKFWIFHHGSSGPGRAVDFNALCRVFDQL